MAPQKTHGATVLPPDPTEERQKGAGNALLAVMGITDHCTPIALPWSILIKDGVEWLPPKQHASSSHCRLQRVWAQCQMVCNEMKQNSKIKGFPATPSKNPPSLRYFPHQRQDSLRLVKLIYCWSDGTNPSPSTPTFHSGISSIILIYISWENKIINKL